MNSYEKKVPKLPKALLRFFLYAFCGALTALPLVITDLWFIGWLSPVPVLLCELFEDRKKDRCIFAYGRGMAYFWSFGIVVFLWFIQLYPLDFLGFERTAALIIVILATCGIPLLQAIVSAFLFVCLSLARRWGLPFRHPVLSAVFSALLFSLFEYFHTLTWAGVPWGRLAVGQTGCLPVVQSASLFGSYFITFLMILCASLLALSLKDIHSGNKRRAAIVSFVALGIFAINFIFGAIRIAVLDSSLEKEKMVSCAAIQGNILFEDKWGDKEWYTMELYRTLTNEAADNGAELILWPETAIPYDYNMNPRMDRLFSSLGTETECETIVTYFESANGKLYNCARLLKPDGTLGESTYKKRHLVPFGEFTPMEELINALFPPLAEMSAIDSPITAGDGTALIDTSHGKVGTLICFDSIYEELCLESVRDGAQLIAVSTNDSWFSGSSALRQHNAQSCLRAVENSRYVLRSANTGISSVISPTGKVLSSLGDSVEGVVYGNVSFLQTRTLYTMTGNVFVYFSALSSAAILVLAFIEHKKRDNKK